MGLVDEILSLSLSLSLSCTNVHRHTPSISGSTFLYNVPLWLKNAGMCSLEVNCISMNGVVERNRLSPNQKN